MKLGVGEFRVYGLGCRVSGINRLCEVDPFRSSKLRMNRYVALYRTQTINLWARSSP